MAIEWDLYQKIRRLYLVDQLSQREIARLLHVSRKTIKKYCTGEILPNARRCVDKLASPQRKAVEGTILRLLEENKDNPRKQKLTAKTLWTLLRQEHGFDIGESTVRRYVQELRNQHPDIFIPLAFEPGEAMEVDWGDAYAYIDGVKTGVSVFCAVLPYSYGIFASVYPDKSNLSFFLGHVRAFEYFNGVPRRCIYDNLKSAVLRGTGKEAVTQKAFRELEAHYAFEAVFCNSAAGWEKGAAENLVSIIRQIAFTPIPHVKDFLALQDHVTARCTDYCQTHRLRSRTRSIREMLEEERAHLLPLPGHPLDVAKPVEAYVYPDLTVRYEGIKYSVPYELAGKKVTLKVTPFHVEVYHQGKKVWTHTRPLRKDAHQYIPEHYLDILLRKPRAIPHAAPLKKGVMPEELSLFQRLYRGKDQNEQLVRLLLLGRKVAPDKLLWAVDKANATGNPTYELVCFYLEMADAPVKEVPDPVPVNKVDLDSYDQWMKGGEPDGD